MLIISAVQASLSTPIMRSANASNAASSSAVSRCFSVVISSSLVSPGAVARTPFTLGMEPCGPHRPERHTCAARLVRMVYAAQPETG